MADEPNDDDFEKMFDELSKMKEAPESTPVTEPVVAAAPEPAPAPAEPVEPVATEPVTEPVVAAAPEPAAPAEPSTRELLERFTEIVARQQPTPAAPAPVQQQAAALYSDEELATLATVEKDFPDLVKAMQIMMRGGLTKNNEFTFSEIAKVLTPALSNVQSVAADHQLSELRRAIPDYNTVYRPVIDWVNTQPGYLQKAYVSVIEGGTVPEITDLVDRWRTATGKPAATSSAKPATELSEAAKQAAVALAPVVSQRTAQVASTPSTFDDAFEAFSEA